MIGDFGVGLASVTAHIHQVCCAATETNPPKNPSIIWLFIWLWGKIFR